MMPSTKTYSVIQAASKQDFENYSIETNKQNHPGDSVAYRINSDSRSFVYSTDVEFNQKNIEQLRTAIDFYNNADILTFDSQYTLKESFSKEDWGHSSIQFGIDIGFNAKIKNLVTFHYDPTYSDEAIDEIIKIGNQYKETTKKDHDFKIIPSYEGLTLKL
jgi:ribonuclease BN (tRNA processing enzyme)